ncbi:MAG: hypothetical protein SAK29_15220 [Scytonema sp. PMC 1069.18]|nr:hypothetical protein [Scytonema sp. PMC 1069.18]MEC4883740.1 hypothetical protein [Scytonema sp. PMC 1070.18]
MPLNKTHKPKPTVETVLQQAAQLTYAEREELLLALKALLEAIDDEKDVAPSTTTSPHCGSRGGSRIEWKKINGYGPYPYLRFRSGGKYRSYYLKDLAFAVNSRDGDGS